MEITTTQTSAFPHRFTLSTGNDDSDAPRAGEQSGVEFAYDVTVSELNRVGRVAEELVDRLRPLLVDIATHTDNAAEEPAGASPHAEALLSLARRARAHADTLTELLHRLDV